MTNIDELPFNDVIALFYEKNQAIREADMTKLIELRNKWPQLFDKEKEAQIRDIIDYAKAFQASDRYKELRRLELKEKLSIIHNDQTNNK